MAVSSFKTIHDIQTDYLGRISEILSNRSGETLLFNYFGDLNQPKSDHILSMVESSVLEGGDKRKTMRRVGGVLIELLQNISIHGARLSDGRMHAYCIVVSGKDDYRILTGNLMLTVDMNLLDAKLKNLLQMDINMIRKTFIETLCNENFNPKGGAGLGLLTIAKRSNKALKYSLIRINDQLGYFQLEVRLSKVS